MKVRIKRIIAAVVFVCILIVSINCLGYFFRPNDMNTDCFAYLDKEDDNTLNVACIGSSAIYRFWIPQQAYEETGITSALVATAAQDMEAIPYLMEEIAKTQEVDLFVVEVRNSIAIEANKLADKYDQEDNTGSFALVATGMKQSLNRLEMIHEILVEDEENTELEWMLPLLKYHDNSHAFTADTIVSRLNGVGINDMYVRQTSAVNVNEKKEFVADDDYVYPQEDKEELDAIIEKGEELGIQVLLVATPYSPGKIRGALQLQMNDYIEEQGYPYLNMIGLEDEIGLDFTTDFYDSLHTNIAGAQKVTSYLANYLNENYTFTSRLNETQTAHWEKMCEKWDTRAEELMEEWTTNKEKVTE